MHHSAALNQNRQNRTGDLGNSDIYDKLWQFITEMGCGKIHSALPPKARQ